jgi:ribosomal protein L16 Arg81 hydroxylase
MQAMVDAGFESVKNATEVVVSSGDILYLPPFWFHYIISQDASIQCNARSGSSHIGSEAISKCFSKKDQSKKEKTAAMSDLLWSLQT